MNVTEFEIEGLDELIKEFSKLGENEFMELKPAATEGAQLVLGRARGKINNKSHTLYKSLKVVKPSNKKTKTGVIFAKVTFSKAGKHAVPLELGHRLWFFGKKTNRDVQEKPFLRPAADESKTEVANIMANGMNKILEEWGD